MPRISDFGGREVERSQTVAGLRALTSTGWRAAQVTAETAEEAAAEAAGIEMVVCRAARVTVVREGLLALLKQVRRLFVFLKRLFANGSTSGTATAAAGKRAGGMDLEVVTRSDRARGFVVLPKRRIAEKTFAWISRNRRPARGFERDATTVAAFARLAMVRVMLKRLAKPSPCS